MADRKATDAARVVESRSTTSLIDRYQHSPGNYGNAIIWPRRETGIKGDFQPIADHGEWKNWAGLEKR